MKKLILPLSISIILIASITACGKEHLNKIDRKLKKVGQWDITTKEDPASLHPIVTAITKESVEGKCLIRFINTMSDLQAVILKCPGRTNFITPMTIKWSDESTYETIDFHLFNTDNFVAISSDGYYRDFVYGFGGSVSVRGSAYVAFKVDGENWVRFETSGFSDAFGWMGKVWQDR